MGLTLEFTVSAKSALVSEGLPLQNISKEGTI
jgi:hypothetical protein